MIDFILYALPWWTPLIVAGPAALLAARYFGVNAALLVAGLGLVAAVLVKVRKSGADAEIAKQHKADDHARDVILEKKEDVRSIPNTPAGTAEREDRFNKWLK